MSGVFGREPQPDELYRFRSIDALIGSRKELSRQTIHLARPDELNALAEDTVNVVWRGDDLSSQVCYGSSSCASPFAIR